MRLSLLITAKQRLLLHLKKFYREGFQKESDFLHGNNNKEKHLYLYTKIMHVCEEKQTTVSQKRAEKVMEKY